MDSESDVLIVSLSGEFDISNAENVLWPQLVPTLDKPKVVIDFSNVSYIDSVALGVLIRKRKIRAQQGFQPAHLAGVRPTLKRIFSLTNLDTIWTLYDSKSEALHALKCCA